METGMKRIIAALLGSLACGAAASAGDLVGLVKTPALAKGLAAFPRLAGSEPAIQKINKGLEQGDRRAKKAAKDCRDQGKDRSDWTRKVEVTMRGPDFVSYVASDDFFCGGANPDTDTLALVYDLATGIPVDWTKLLPASAEVSAATATAGDGTVLGTVASPKLKELYLKNLHITDVDDPHQCDDVLKDADLSFILWPDVKADGLVLAQMDLPHVAAACGPPATVPMAALRELGVDAGFLDAIEAGHKAARE
jgi:hypothetical protein